MVTCGQFYCHGNMRGDFVPGFDAAVTRRNKRSKRLGARAAARGRLVGRYHRALRVFGRSCQRRLVCIAYRTHIGWQSC